MIIVGERQTESPDTYNNELQEQVYRFLNKMDVPFERVDTDEAVTMEDCILINQRLDMQMVKTLFLCNRQQTEFYLFVTTGDKPFKSREFSDALHIPRVSFAPAEMMEPILGTKIGAATIFSALLESAGKVEFVLDKDVAAAEWYGCSDGTTTSYMKIATAAITSTLWGYTGRRLSIIQV